jgi:hypothetical protein
MKFTVTFVRKKYYCDYVLLFFHVTHFFRVFTARSKTCQVIEQDDVTLASYNHFFNSKYQNHLMPEPQVTQVIIIITHPVMCVSELLGVVTSELVFGSNISMT